MWRINLTQKLNKLELTFRFVLNYLRHFWLISFYFLVIFNWDKQRIPDQVILSNSNPMMIKMGKCNGFRTVMGDFVSIFYSISNFCNSGNGKRGQEWSQTLFPNQNPQGVSDENWSLQTKHPTKCRLLRHRRRVGHLQWVIETWPYMQWLKICQF